MDKAPLATKAATSAAIFGASDACAQKLERVEEPDVTRLLTTTAIGGLYFAPAARIRRGIVRAERRGHASMASRWSRRNAIATNARWRGGVEGAMAGRTEEELRNAIDATARRGCRKN